jgi:hypothetical protein
MNTMITLTRIVSIFIVTAGIAMTVSGFAIPMIPLLAIGIPTAAFGCVLFLL